MVKKWRRLNIGCGNETYGTHFVDLYPSRKEVIKCDVDKERLPFPDNYFDEVYSRNLLEHLKNPGFALKEMVRVLKPSGKLILITDNANYIGFTFSIFGSKMHLGGYRGRGQKDVHYSIFTAEHLRNHLKSLGLKSIKIEYKDAYASKTVKIIRKLLALLSRKSAFPHIKAEARK